MYMKRLLLLVLIIMPLTVFAQSKVLIPYSDSTQILLKDFRKISSHINLEFASSMNAYFTGNQFDECSFRMNRVRFEIYGKLNSRLSYHFRQSYNTYSIA